MNAKELATLLNWRERNDEISLVEEKEAEENWLLIIFWSSDDCLEFRWIISDELWCFDKEETRDFYFDLEYSKCFEEWLEDDVEFEEDYIKNIVSKHIKNLPKISVESENTDWFIWYISTEIIDHEVFEIYEEWEKFCRWIVVNTKNI